MRRPKRFRLSDFGRDEAACKAKVERSFDQKVRRLEWFSDKQAQRLNKQLRRLGPADPIARMASVSVHSCNEFTIGSGITGALEANGYETALSMWEDGEPLVPDLPGIGSARQAVLSRWVADCWERCAEEALDVKWQTAEIYSQLDALESTLASKKAELARQKAARLNRCGDC